MSMSRWKLLAGVFGLGVCGLAALAEPACRTTGHGPNRQQPVADAKPKSEPKPTPGGTLPPPLEILPPLPGEVKPAPAPAPLPSLPPATLDPKPAETKLPSLPPTPAPTELTLPMVSGEKAKPTELPALPLPGGSNIPPATAVPDAQPGALPGLPPIPAGGSGLPSPGPQPLPLPEPKPEVTPLPLPTTEVKGLPLPQQLPTPTPQPTPPVTPTPLLLPTPQLTPPVAPDVKAVEVRSTPIVEKRLKVTLQMGDGNPRFEIRDGDEVVLKVVSDKIDVKAPTEKGDLWSTLKASGRVKFQSPGGDGYCDELTIIPGTCEVIATGKVQFKYNWGKVETAVTSERMTFRLGAVPEAR